MSKENINEEQVNETTSQATENENNVAETNNELNELRESNANLIAERETLMAEVKKLKQTLGDESAAKSRMWKYWQNEEKKVQLLLAFIDSGIKGTEYMNASEFVKRLIEGM